MIVGMTPKMLEKYIEYETISNCNKIYFINHNKNIAEAGEIVRWQINLFPEPSQKKQFSKINYMMRFIVIKKPH